MGSKSATFRVTTVNPWLIPVAAIRASRLGHGSGTCSLAARRATATSTGRMRPSKTDRRSSSNHTWRRCAWAESRLANRAMPSHRRGAHQGKFRSSQRRPAGWRHRASPCRREARSTAAVCARTGRRRTRRRPGVAANHVDNDVPLLGCQTDAFGGVRVPVEIGDRRAGHELLVNRGGEAGCGERRSAFWSRIGKVQPRRPSSDDDVDRNHAAVPPPGRWSVGVPLVLQRRSWQDVCEERGGRTWRSACGREFCSWAASI